MPKVYLYIPFSDEEENKELLEQAREWKNKRLDKYFFKDMREADSEEDDNTLISKNYDNVEIIFFTKENRQFRPLNAVTHKDKIYILAHGNSTTTKVFSVQDNCNFAITQYQLAQRVIQDGLPENTSFSLKLFFVMKITLHNIEQNVFFKH